MSSRTLTAESACSRLDVFLSEQLEGLSHKKAREFCESGGVRLNGKVSRAGIVVRAGDVITIAELEIGVEFLDANSAEVREANFTVHFETERLLIVEKPRAIASVRLSSKDPLTVADLLAAHCPPCIDASPDRREAGLVQRLDFYTSGLLLAAKDRDCWELLRSILLAGEMKKSYLALVEGAPKRPQQIISLALKQSVDGKSMETATDDFDENAVAAQSEIELVKKLDAFSVVRVRGKRMRRHQVRVHLKEIGCPLVGDEQYGAREKLSWFFPERDGFLLHAEEISFTEPFVHTERLVHSKSALFEDLLKRS